MFNQLSDKQTDLNDLLHKLSQKEVLSFMEACEFLNLSSSYLYKLTHKRRIPHYKPGGKKIYFRRTELEVWLLKNRVKTSEEIENEAINRVHTLKRR